MSLGRNVPELYQGIAADAEKSRAAAVKLFCLECVGYVRKDVTDCTATHCPLHPWRPYQKSVDSTEESSPVALDDAGMVPDTPETEMNGQTAENDGGVP